MTRDRVKVFEQETGFKLSMNGKLCDFCDKKLPVSWTSIQCKLCPTIYDICDDCAPQKENEICHLCNNNASGGAAAGSIAVPPYSNAVLTKAEKEHIRASLNYPMTVFYFDSIASKELCDYCVQGNEPENANDFDAKLCAKSNILLISLQKWIEKMDARDATTAASDITQDDDEPAELQKEQDEQESESETNNRLMTALRKIVAGGDRLVQMVTTCQSLTIYL